MSDFFVDSVPFYEDFWSFQRFGSIKNKHYKGDLTGVLYNNKLSVHPSFNPLFLVPIRSLHYNHFTIRRVKFFLPEYTQQKENVTFAIFKTRYFQNTDWARGLMTELCLFVDMKSSRTPLLSATAKNTEIQEHTVFETSDVKKAYLKFYTTTIFTTDGQL